MASSEENRVITWNEKLEEYFTSTGEKAHCLGWLHKKSEAAFSRKTTFIDLPVIILSTLIGATSIGSKSLFGESPIAPIVLGIISIFVSILNTVGAYFSWSRRAEAHRISNIQYSRMYRNISVEMSLPRNERSLPAELLRYIRVEYDRLSEISPLIPPEIIALFNDKFSNEKEISQPEEVNGLEKIEVYIPKKVDVDINTEIYKEQEEEKVELPTIDITPQNIKLPTAKPWK
jgi:hypothetical protein